MIRRTLFIILLSLCINQFSEAQLISSNAPFIAYTSEDGLSQQVVRAVVQDIDGFIWVGTEDGLNKFDGYDFKIYRSIRSDSSSLPDNFIYSLTPASDGGIWVGTNSGGLAKYNKTTDSFKSYQHDPNNIASLSSNRVETIFEDADGIVWIGTGTSTGGLHKLNQETGVVTRYLHSEESINKLLSTSVIAIADDGNGFLWVRTYSDLIVFDKAKDTFEKIDVPLNQVGDISDKSLTLDNDGFMWITAGNSLLKIDTKTKEYQQVYFTNYPADQVSLVDMEIFNDDYFWLSDFANGIYFFNKSDYSVTNFNHSEANPNSILAGAALALLQDQTGSLWVGVHSKGLNKLNINRKKFQHFKPDAHNLSTVSGSVIKGILMDSRNNIWVSVDSRVEKLNYNNDNGQGVYIRDTSSKYTQITSSQPNCFFEDSYNNIWIGTWGDGIIMVQGGNINSIKRFQSDGTENTILDNIVQAIYEDRSGNFWIGSETGLGLYNPNTGIYRSFLHDPEDSNSMAPYGVQANCIVEDAYGNIWVGTWGGLTRLVPHDISLNSFDTDYDFVRYVNNSDDINTISDNRIISLYYDKEVNPDEIYAGTYGTGLNRITFNNDNTEENKIKSYIRLEGLPNDVVYSILSDHEGFLWVSTNDGLAKFNPRNESIEVYDVNDGLQANQFFWGARAKGNNGELLFGGINGFNMFQPSDIIRDQSIPSVVFTDLKVLNKSVLVGEKVNKHIILKQGINLTDKIKLSHKENVFTIEFAGLHYAFPANNKYRYMLEGFDETWVEVDSRKRFASYTNLDHGNYTFKIDASNYDGIWTQQPREIEIIIKPPFWKRMWFRLLIILLFVYSIYYVYSSRTEKVKREKELLEGKIREGQKIIDEKVSEVEKQQEEIRKRDIDEQEMRFMNRGIAKFSEILSSSDKDLRDLTQLIISEMVTYVEGVMGVVYIYQENENDGCLEQYGTYAPDSKTLERQQIKVGEGYVGTCFFDGKINIVKNIPNDYSQLTSGLGEIQPRTISFIPIQQKNNKQGVLEIASLEPLEDYKINFIEKIGENITSVIAIRKSGEKLNVLLEQSNQQTEVLRSQEEEMRQNMEEMFATQEEMTRREGDWAREKEELIKTQKELKKENEILNQKLNQKS
jgi:ligand-binding sensor domain-containing protein